MSANLTSDWDALIPTDMAIKEVHIIYFMLGGFISIFGLLSLVIKERLYMSEAMVATIIGILVGPLVGNQFDPNTKFGGSFNAVFLEFTRVVIVIQCMACGVDLPGNYLWRERASLLMLIGPIMVLKWIVAAVIIYLLAGVSFLYALIVAACLTPTDPVLANSIVKGKFAEAHIPLNVRLILSAESGMNDGLGTPFLYLALYLMRYDSVGLAIGDWLWKVVLYQVVLAVVIGVLVAWVAQLALKVAESRGWIDKESLLSYSIALALFLMGFVSLIGADDILAVFIAGNVLTWDHWFNQKIKLSHFQEIIDNLFNLSYFIFFGSVVPFSKFNTVLSVWKFAVIAILMVLRRTPIVMGLQRWIPALKSNKEAFFAGFFGPMGASALFYALIAVVSLGVDPHPMLEIVYFTVLASVVVHGGSVPFFNLTLKRYQTYANWASTDAIPRPTLPQSSPPANSSSPENRISDDDTLSRADTWANFGYWLFGRATNGGRRGTASAMEMNITSEMISGPLSVGDNPATHSLPPGDIGPGSLRVPSRLTNVTTGSGANSIREFGDASLRSSRASVAGVNGPELGDGLPKTLTAGREEGGGIMDAIVNRRVLGNEMGKVKFDETTSSVTHEEEGPSHEGTKED
ncbi:hypothetical protein HK101_003368, partial [Irineochytrium annulatum]